jgi:predicted O-methyltransferase YrrM
MINITADLCEHIGTPPSEALLPRKPSWAGGAISQFDQPLLIGLTKLLQPKKVVEIGVASGWSGLLFISALLDNKRDAEYIGIDYSPKFYLDNTRETGSVIAELLPDTGNVGKRLLLGKTAVDFLDEVGNGVDLAFIDGDHMHPWATIDLLTLLPVLSPGAYVLMHDISLSTFPRHKHTNRGPKYLYECWPYHKIHSSQDPPMIGAIRMPTRLETPVLRILLDTLYTPWEVHVDDAMLDTLAARLRSYLGAEWGDKFRTAFQEMNAAAFKNPHIGTSDPSRAVVRSYVDLANKLGDAKKAVSCLALAASYFPDDSNLLHQLSIAYSKAGNAADAVATAKKCVDIEPSNPNFGSYYGQLLLDSGAVEQAEPHLRTATERMPSNAVFRYRLARALQGMGRVSEALSEAAAALELSPDNLEFARMVRSLEESQK